MSINKDQRTRSTFNFTSVIEKVKRKFNQWLLRDLSLKSGTLITKAEGISIDNKSIKDIDLLLFKFLWKKTHYIKINQSSWTYENGGFNFLDFNTLNNTFKINWIKQFLKNPNSLWNFIPNYIFSKTGGFKFLLMCNYNIEKIPIRLSNFHKQALLCMVCDIQAQFFSALLFYMEQWRYTLQKQISILQWMVQ